ncbi:MAG TPA: PAS domain S-box protein [Rhodocyclaceae bacterium]|nr:PAS domain S-box protein [Rhodocyclaceae bacterium]
MSAATPASFFRWLLAGNLLAISILLALVGLILSQDKAAYEERATLATRNLAQVLDQNIAALVAKTDVSLQTVVHEAARQSARGGLDEAALNALLARQQSLLPELSFLRIADAEGNIRYGRAGLPPHRRTAAERGFFIQARQNDQAGLIVDGPNRLRSTQRWVVFLARRLDGADGRFLGVVYAAIDSEHFHRLFSRTDLGAGSAIALRTADMRLIARHPMAPEGTSAIGTATVPAKLKEILLEHPLAGSYTSKSSVDGIERITSYSRIGDYPLYILVALAPENWFAFWWEEVLRVSALTALVILVMVLSSWIAYRLWRRQWLAAESLRQSEERFRLMLESVRDYAVFMLNAQGRVATWNEGASRLTGFAAGEIVGHPLSMLYPASKEKDDDPGEALRQADAAGSMASENWRLRKNGTLFMANTAITAVRDSTGRLRGFTVILRDVTEQRLAEQAARKANSLLLEAVDSIAVGFSIYDPDDRLVICNQAYRDLYNTSRDLIVPGVRFEDLIRYGAERGQYPEAAGNLEAWIEERVRLHRTANGTPVGQQLDDGRHLLIVEYRTPSGHIVGNRMDITELHRHQHQLEQLVDARTAELKASIAQFRILIEQAPTAMAMFDRNLSYLAVSRLWLKEYGDGHGNLIGRNYYDIHPDIPQRWKSTHRAALAGAILRNDEDLWVHADGSSQWLRWSIYPWTDEKGAIGGIIISIEDITDRKRAAERLRESEVRFRSAFEQAAVGLAHVSLDGQLLRVNQKLCAITGYGREELVGHSFREISAPADVGATLSKARQVLAGAIPSCAMERRYRRRDGSLVWVNLTLSLAQTPAGQPDYFIAVVEDIQRRKEAEQALAEEREARQQILERQVAERTAELVAANRELQGFTYAASHDLKAPLGRINSFSGLLEAKYRDRLEGDGLLFLEFIRKNATRMNILIEDLLAHAQIEQKIPDLCPMDLQVAVQAALKEREAEMQQGGVQVRLDVPPVTVRANPHGLAQVLNNLLENALKYSSQARPPVIEIGARVEDGHCRLWIRDNGIGFDMVYHDRIFEIFRRLHTYEEFPGSGVGLALVRKAMERMGGRVWAESAPGRGATFYLELATVESAVPSRTAPLGQAE